MYFFYNPFNILYRQIRKYNRFYQLSMLLSTLIINDTVSINDLERH